jgi:hypothetical protein
VRERSSRDDVEGDGCRPQRLVIGSRPPSPLGRFSPRAGSRGPAGPGFGSGPPSSPAAGRASRLAPGSQQVVGVRVGNDVQILGAADEPVRPDSDAPDHHELDAVVVERAEQGPEVRTRSTRSGGALDGAQLLAERVHACQTLAHRRVAVCFQGRIARARSSSSMSPLSALVVMRPSLTAPLAGWSGGGGGADRRRVRAGAELSDRASRHGDRDLLAGLGSSRC